LISPVRMYSRLRRVMVAAQIRICARRCLADRLGSWKPEAVQSLELSGVGVLVWYLFLFLIDGLFICATLIFERERSFFLRDWVLFHARPLVQISRRLQVMVQALVTSVIVSRFLLEALIGVRAPVVVVLNILLIIQSRILLQISSQTGQFRITSLITVLLLIPLAYLFPAFLLKPSFIRSA
jgi:hypothetical protein